MSQQMTVQAWADGYGVWDGAPVCEICDGTGVAEEPVYGRFAAEASRPTPCPRCKRREWEADQAAFERRAASRARHARGAA